MASGTCSSLLCLRFQRLRWWGELETGRESCSQVVGMPGSINLANSEPAK